MRRCSPSFLPQSSDSLNDNTGPPPLRPDDCTPPRAPPPLRPDDCTPPRAPPPLRPDDCTPPRAPPPPPLSSPQRVVHPCPSPHNDRPQAQLNGDPNLVHYLNFLVEEVNTTKKIEEDNGSSFVKYVDVQPQIQVGPTCGLLALSVVANLVRPVTVDNLLQMAKDKGFTKHGEMFSARNMCSLAQEVIGEHCDVVLHRHDMLFCCPDSVWDLLLNNRIFLVPYDKDKDNSPGIYGGHKAHWCVILGVGVCSGERFYCTAQGKSLKLSLWKTESLAASNKQLFEIQPDLMDSNSHVTCSIRDELAGCCISFNFHEAKEKEDYESMVTFGLLILAETLNMYIISGFGESITTEVELFIEWPKLDITNRRLMLNFQVGITNPVIVKAGGLVAICMDTFSSIMNTSYSFLNIMNAS